LDAINRDFVSLLRGAVDGLEGSGWIYRHAGPPPERGRDCVSAAGSQAYACTLDEEEGYQLEGRSIKEQVKAPGLAEIAKRSVNVFEVNMMPEEFCERYRDGLHVGGIAEGDEREVIGQARTVFGLSEKDLVLGVYKVLSSLFKLLL